MLVAGDDLSVLSTASSSTRTLAGDVTGQSFAFICHGPHQKEYLELHVYVIPGRGSLFPDTGMVLHLKGFDAQVLYITLYTSVVHDSDSRLVRLQHPHKRSHYVLRRNAHFAR
jgi:hypothetical protein